MTQKLLLSIPALLALAACGGGGDAVTTVPAQAQYSSTTSTPNWTTTLPMNLSSYVKYDGTNVTFSQKVANVEYKQWNAGRGGHDVIDVQIDGEVITLTWDLTDQLHKGTHNGKDYRAWAEVVSNNDPNASENVVEVVIFGSQDPSTQRTTNLTIGVVGFETPDSVVAAATGTASYSGNGEIYYNSANCEEISEIQTNFAVDFNNSTISGTINVDDPTSSSQIAPGTYTFATATIPQTALTGNGFSA